VLDLVGYHAFALLHLSGHLRPVLDSNGHFGPDASQDGYVGPVAFADLLGTCRARSLKHRIRPSQNAQPHWDMRV